MKRSPGLRILLTIFIGAVLSPLAWAQTKPIRVLVGLPPGGGVEAASRVYAEKLRASLGQPVIVENRVGGSGLIAMDALRAAPADGSVLLFAPNGGVTLIPQTFKRPRFDPFKDVVPVAMVGQTAVTLAVRASVSAQSLAEYVALAKADPQYRGFGSAPGTIPHLVTALIANATGMEVLHVPYKGAGQVIVDLLGGQLQAAVVTAGESLPHQRAGKVRILANAGAERSALLPDVPTLRELGHAIDVSAWFGFYAPAGTPQATIDKLGGALIEASRAADLRERLAQFGIEAIGVNATDTAQKMRADYEMWRRAIALAGFALQE